MVKAGASSMTWTQSGTNYVIANDVTLTKSGTNWTDYCHTETFSGNFDIVGMVASTTSIIGGISDATQITAGTDEKGATYGIYFIGGGRLRQIVQGATVGTDTVGTTGKIIFDGSTVKFYVDDVLIHTVTSPPITTDMFGYGAVYGSGQNLQMTMTKG